ncbi:peptidoglycan-binding protein [Candidatus Omnitrophota bacterium]
MRRIYFSLVAILFLISFSGCATTGKSVESSELREEMGALETRMKELEKGQKQLENMVVNQISLQEEAVKSGYVIESSARKEVIANPSKKDIQVALKNAGYYTGNIDGKFGPKTANAIMEFQKDHGLKEDGVAGSKTWEILGHYYK